MVTIEIREHFYARLVEIIRISQVKFTILLHILISSQFLDAKKHRLVNEKLPAEENHGGTSLRIFLQIFFFAAFRFSTACFNALSFTTSQTSSWNVAITNLRQIFKLSHVLHINPEIEIKLPTSPYNFLNLFSPFILYYRSFILYYRFE